MKRTSVTARRMLAAVVLASGCGAPAPDLDGNNLSRTTAAARSTDSSKIIGKNDLVAVAADGSNVPEAYRSTLDAYGQINVGCTATHIGNGIVLTAGHCFSAPIVRSEHVACPDVVVSWGMRGSKAFYLQSTCDEIISEQQNGDIDYAIFKVTPAPPVAVEVDLSNRPPNGRKLTIFGYPQMRPLEWSQYCTLEPGSNGNYGDNQFSHQCDTEPGNSGSTVLDASSGKVLGIHDGGLVPWNYATYLYDTPLASIIGGDTGGSSGGGGGDTEIPDQWWGPFGNQLDVTLITMGEGYSGRISFNLAFDVETTYDFVYVTDGLSRTRIYTGNSARRFQGSAALVAPVTIRFTSDWEVMSNYVGISGVVFH